MQIGLFLVLDSAFQNYTTLSSTSTAFQFSCVTCKFESVWNDFGVMSVGRYGQFFLTYDAFCPTTCAKGCY